VTAELPALAVEALVAGYEPGLPIVRGATLELAPREIVALLGPNGAGKSTLVKAVVGLVPVASGRVRLGLAEITNARPHTLVRRGLAFVPQTENVFPDLTVQENLELAAAVLDRERKVRIAAVLDLFRDLARQRRLAAGRLSGGQRQMLALARALVVAPSIMVLDEPSAGLSPKLVHEVFAQLAAIRDRGVAILLVEQNVRAALAVADRAYVLVEGRERLVGRAADLARDPRLRDLYLGGAAA
jgi:branched-chain amino acid transport system ATP-binding protein